MCTDTIHNTCLRILLRQLSKVWGQPSRSITYDLTETAEIDTMPSSLLIQLLCGYVHSGVIPHCKSPKTDVARETSLLPLMPYVMKVEKSQRLTQKCRTRYTIRLRTELCRTGSIVLVTLIEGHEVDVRIYM